MSHTDILPADAYWHQHLKRFYRIGCHFPCSDAFNATWQSRHAEFPQFRLPYEIPLRDTDWQHHNGNVYTVQGLTNFWSDRQDEYPTTVTYRGPGNKEWSRPLSRWYQSMTRVPYDA